MPAVEPVLAHHALNHLVVDRVLRIRIRSMTKAIYAGKVLVVQIRIVCLGFVGVQATAHGQDFGRAAIATKGALRVELDHVMADVTVVGTSQADSGPLIGISSCLGIACQTCV